MTQIIKVRGMPELLRNIKRAKVYHPQGVKRGLAEGALFIQRESQLRVPVDTGNLKASAFTRLESLTGPIAYLIGYTAKYAIFVHEAVGMKLKGIERSKATRKLPDGREIKSQGYYWDPQGKAQAKFLESVAREKRREILLIVKTIAERWRIK